MHEHIILYIYHEHFGIHKNATENHDLHCGYNIHFAYTKIAMIHTVHIVQKEGHSLSGLA